MYNTEVLTLTNDDCFGIVYSSYMQADEECPPVVVIVYYQLIDRPFTKHLVRYAKNEFQTVNLILLIVSSEGYTEDLESCFETKSQRYYAETNCTFWAKECLLISKKSIENFIDQKPMNKLVELAFCLINDDEERKKLLEDSTVATFNCILTECNLENASIGNNREIRLLENGENGNVVSLNFFVKSIVTGILDFDLRRIMDS